MVMMMVQSMDYKSGHLMADSMMLNLVVEMDSSTVHHLGQLMEEYWEVMSGS